MIHTIQESRTTLKRRFVGEHTIGIHPESYTYTRRPVVLKYCKQFKYILDAIAWEKQLKGWSRKKKEALFRDDWNEIVRLSNLKCGQSSAGSG